MNETALALSGVSKSYGSFAAVSGLTFSVRRGEIYGFLGPNGAGKTTTLRMLLGIIAPDAGTISVLGRESVASVKPRVGYLPEERGLYRKMRAAETIAYFGRLKGMDAKRAMGEARTLLERFGLGAFADTRIEGLSKGMAQKVQILSTIVHGPDLIILDEPFSGLDPVNQQTLEDLIAGEARKGRTILFSTHVMQHAERLCQRFVLIARGKKLFEGTVNEARARLPRRIHLALAEDEGGAGRERLSRLPGVAAVAPGDDGLYALDLAASASGEAVLKACFDSGLALRRFDLSEPSLHDVFVSFVGKAEGAHAAPAREAA